MSEPSFEFVEDVTSDVSFVARADSLPGVFAAAAAALVSVTIEDPEALGEVAVRRLALGEPDVELLLLRFLNELIYLRDAEELLLRPRNLRIESVPDDVRLTGELVGERLDPGRHRLASEVKAATAHGLSVVRSGEEFRATVTLDV